MATWNYLAVFVIWACVFISTNGSEDDVEGTGKVKEETKLESAENMISSKFISVNLPWFVRKRNNPPTGFEDMERNYLISKCISYLHEFIGFAEKVNNDTETRTRLQQVLEKETRKIHSMNVAELKQYMTNLHHALQHSDADDHTIVISGQTYSMQHVSDWCCNFGG